MIWKKFAHRSHNSVAFETFNIVVKIKAFTLMHKSNPIVDGGLQVYCVFFLNSNFNIANLIRIFLKQLK